MKSIVLLIAVLTWSVASLAWPVIKFNSESQVFSVVFSAFEKKGEAHTLYQSLNIEPTTTYQTYNGPGLYDTSYLSPRFDLLVSNYSNLGSPSKSKVLTIDEKTSTLVGSTDASLLLNKGWRPPMEVTALAKDEKTKLFGILYLPSDYDPQKKYPLVNFIYGGPQYKQTAWSFMDRKKQFAFQLAELGFIVLQMDSRGTPGRGKAFQDHNYQKFGQVEVYEHKYFIEQLIERYPFIDAKRIGVVGSSYGGFQALHFITRVT